MLLILSPVYQKMLAHPHTQGMSHFPLKPSRERTLHLLEPSKVLSPRAPELSTALKSHHPPWQILLISTLPQVTLALPACMDYSSISVLSSFHSTRPPTAGQGNSEPEELKQDRPSIFLLCSSRYCCSPLFLLVQMQRPSYLYTEPRSGQVQAVWLMNTSWPRRAYWN